MMPLVGIVCDRRSDDGTPVHQANDEYIVAIQGGAGALPLLIPSTDAPLPIAEILARLDGLLFTGSPSNVVPRHYGGHPPRDASLLDETRDTTTLPLIRAAIEAGKPVLCICRGFQELNVALGGTLHQHVHELPGRLDHREDETAPVEVQYGPAHPIRIAACGVLARLAQDIPGMTHEAMVNSLHHQGIDRLAPPLRAEASAPDGQVEAVSMPDARAFLLGVQWHPEWRWSENPLSRAIFAAFGDAMRSHPSR
jgi:putative glutamine amidotransferase